MTVDGQDRLRRRKEYKEVLDELLDSTFGGRIALKDTCLDLGLDLKELIERGTAELGSLHYAEEGVGANLVSKQRESSTVMRDCTWGALATWVQEKIQHAELRRHGPGATLTTVCETTVRRYCVQKCARSLQAKRADPIADVSYQQLKAAAFEFNIDARFGHAQVRLFEEAFFDLQSQNIMAIERDWDDHSKWEPDKKRSYTRKRTILVRREFKTAPHSDMKLSMGGVKAVTNSMLLLMPTNTAEYQDGNGISSKRGHPVLKQAYAVTRLENERRSTPCQQMNDWRFIQEADERLHGFIRRCVALFSLSDSGWDHDQRNTEVRYWLTWDHLHSDRNYDANYVRPADLSSYNEAERVNGSQTAAVTRAHVPSMMPLGRPTNTEELTRNKRGFQTAIVNCIATAGYAGRKRTNEIMGNEADVDLVDEWFADRRLKLFQKDEEAKRGIMEKESNECAAQDM
eukprot:gene26566-32615_t